MPSALVQSGKIFTPASQVLSPERQFLLMLKIVLERSYQERIDQFVNWSLDDKSVISGAFRDGNRLFNFRLSDTGLEYSPAQNTRARGDSQEAGSLMRRDERTMVFRIDQADYEQIQQQYPSAFRYDLKHQRKPRKCNGVTAYSCGGGCIVNAKTCRIGQKAIATPAEMKALTQLGRQLKFKTATAPGSPPTPAAKPLHEMTIRELRREARNRGIAGYSHINTKDALLTTIKAWDAAPSEQRRIRKVLEKRQKQIEDDPLREIKKLFGLSGKLVNNPAFAGAVFLGVTAFTYNNLKDRYTGNFHKSVDLAKDRASGIPVEKVKKTATAITFTVDGFDDTNDPNKGKVLKDALLAADPEFFGSQHMIAVPGPEFTMLDETPADVTGPMREVTRIFKGTQRMLGNAVINGYNPQAVELAAQVVAYHRQYPDKQINLVGHSAGGMVIHEAGELIKRMTPVGPTLAANLRVVTLGTPSFGFAGKVTSNRDGNSGRTVGINSAGDPFNVFPGVNKQLVNTVKGHSVAEYTGDERAMQVMKETLGAYDAQNANLNRPPKPQPALPRKDPANAADPRNAPGFQELAATSPQDATKLLVEWSEKEEKAQQRAATRTRREKAAATSVAIASREYQKAQTAAAAVAAAVATTTAASTSSTPPPSPPSPPSPPAAPSARTKPKTPKSGGGGAAATSSNTPASATAKTTPSSTASSVTGGASSSSSKPAPAEPAKKKRGRPPKATSTASAPATASDRPTPAAAPAVEPPVAPGSGRMVRKGQESKKAASKTAEASATATTAGEVDHTAETGFTFRSAKAPYVGIDLRTLATEKYGKGLERLSESEKRELLKETQDKLNTAIEKGYTLSWGDKESGKQTTVSRAEDIHPMDMIDDEGDVRLNKPKTSKTTAVPAAAPTVPTGAPAASPTPASTVASAPAAKAKRGRPPKAASQETSQAASPVKTPANPETASTQAPSTQTTSAIPTPGSPEWQSLEAKIRTEAKDKTGLTPTQKSFVAARVLYGIKNGEVVALPPLRSEGKKTLEAIAKMRETRRQAESAMARSGKQATSIDAEYFVGTEGTNTKGIDTLVQAGMGTSDRKGYFTLNDEGKKQMTAFEASQKAPKISLDLPANGGKFTIAPNSLSVNSFLKGLGLQPSNLETSATQLWEADVPDWVRSGKRGDALTPEYVQQQSSAYQQAFYETALRFHRSAKGA